MVIIRNANFEMENNIDLSVDFSSCDNCNNSCYDCGISDCTDHCSGEEW